MSDADPTVGEDGSLGGDVPLRPSFWPWLLSLIAALLPLILVAVLRQPLNLSEAFVGGVVLFSVALLVVVNVASFRRLRRSGNGQSGKKRPSGAAETAHATVEASVVDEASYDRLTGLPTFHAFSQRLLAEFQQAKASGESLAVVLVDINQLAMVNEQFGPEAGDEVLRHVTASLQLCKRQGDFLARMGDDEFGLVLSRCTYEGAHLFVERAQERLARASITVSVQGRPTSIWVGICAGAAVAGPATSDADEVLTAAVDDLKTSRIKRDRKRERWRNAA